MASRGRLLQERYSHRECHPEISRAFNEPLSERIHGMPTLEDLQSSPAALSFLSSIGEKPLLQYSISAMKGVIIRMAVTFADSQNRPLAVSGWEAGSGIFFKYTDKRN
jgi:hypothetical protein